MDVLCMQGNREAVVSALMCYACMGCALMCYACRHGPAAVSALMCYARMRIERL
jgi:hypothetical protein